MLVALLSVIVLSSTGYGWALLKGPGGGLHSTDVIGDGFSAPDGAMDILLVGNDSRTDVNGNPLDEEVLQKLRTTDDEGGDLTDTMIVIRVPNDGKRASAMSFPRDTLVDYGQGKEKLNSAMGFAKNQERQKLQQQGVTDPAEVERRASVAGQKFLIQTLEDFSGISIDHYAEVNLLGFHDITQAVGGVDVCLNDAVDDPKSGASFPKGHQTIQGADALAFVRQRYGLPRGDLDRVVRQQVFMSGLVKKMLDSGTLSNPSKLTSLYNAVKKSVVIDEGWDPLQFAEQMQDVAGGDIQFQTIPVELVGESGEEDMVADPTEVQRFAKNLLLDPEQREAQQKKQASISKQRAATTVDVYNASGVTQLAGRVSEDLTAQGFGTGASANSESMPKSVVYHAPGNEAAAKDVAKALDGLPTETKDTLGAGRVEVYLGGDYSGPGAQSFGGSKTVQLDGMQQSPAPQPSQGQSDQEQPITANGVPCIN